jgi:hypothetical protein
MLALHRERRDDISTSPRLGAMQFLNFIDDGALLMYVFHCTGALDGVACKRVLSESYPGIRCPTEAYRNGCPNKYDVCSGCLESFEAQLRKMSRPPDVR